MNILIVGGGGREHALAWKAAQSSNVQTVFVAPGNAGTAAEPKVQNVDIAAEDIPALLSFAQQENIGLTIIGPEAPLVAGIVDDFMAAGLPCFGPSKKSAQLEASKGFTKDFLQRHNIPTAAYARFTETAPALEYVAQQGAPIVVKADGLAAGKGVILAETVAEAQAAVKDILDDGMFGQAGAEVVIEEFLTGEEASFIVMVDGKNILALATSQDHKAAYDGDTGPNTGGMGAYSPAPVVTPEMHNRIMDEVIIPTVKGMAAEDAPYTGFLYAGIMVAADGTPNVLEYNCRFGDPETQPIMSRLQSDLPELCLAALAGELDTATAQWDSRSAVGVVMAASGYPNAYPKGDVISGLDDITTAKVFHAGTALNDQQQVVTNGGRVLCVTALGDSVAQAQTNAYASVSKISWHKAEYRKDIGYRAIARETAQ